MSSEKIKDLDELLECTAGFLLCPKCGNCLPYGHVREFNNVDLAVVDWTCDECGHKWSSCCVFEDGVLVVGEDDEDSYEIS